VLLLKNCVYLSPDGAFVAGDISIDGDKILDTGSIIPSEDCEVMDLGGLKVVPGFIDIHFHGAVGYDIMDASPEEFKLISNYLAKNGTTSYLATTITSTEQKLRKTIKKISTCANEEASIGSSILGVHVEGPYINETKKGCHNSEWMRTPSIEELKEFKKSLGEGLKLHLTVAPEIYGALEFIKYAVHESASVSIGHSSATAEVTRKAVENGAVSFTHLFNAMKGIDHREPGVAGAALILDSFTELICDGVHVHPDIINLIYRLKGKDRIVLVTDAMKAAGLGDGSYEFGGFKVIVNKGIARKEDGTLASSTLTMLEAVKNMIKFTEAPLEAAVLMASRNPAQAVGSYDKVGSIEAGKMADLIVMDDNLDIVKIFCRGNLYSDHINRREI
jgi:N-acetylglucosamine-6-phosphate deacetylase